MANPIVYGPAILWRAACPVCCLFSIRRELGLFVGRLRGTFQSDASARATLASCDRRA